MICKSNYMYHNMARFYGNSVLLYILDHDCSQEEEEEKKKKHKNERFQNSVSEYVLWSLGQMNLLKI